MTATFARFVPLIMFGWILTSCVGGEDPVPVVADVPPLTSSVIKADPALVEQSTVIELSSDKDRFCGVLEQWDGSGWKFVGGLPNPDSGGESSLYEILQPELFACTDEGVPMTPTRFEMTGWEPGWYRVCSFWGGCSNTIELW